MTDVTDLITDEHSRILRLFGALDDLARRPQIPCGTAGLASTWDRLAHLLYRHVQAEEEICYPALFPAITRNGVLRDLTADYDDICEGLAEARLYQPGTTLWWQAVTSARAAAHRHIRAGTQHLMPLLGRAAAQRRGLLGQQWTAFITARLRDSGGTSGVQPETGRMRL